MILLSLPDVTPERASSHSHQSCAVVNPNSLGTSSFLHLALRLIGSRDNRGRLGNVLAEDVTFDEVWKPDGQLVADKLAGGDGEDLCGKEDVSGCRD